MSYLRVLIAILFISLVAAGQSKREQFVKDELLVKFRSGSNRAKSVEFHSRLGNQLLEILGDTGWQRIRLGPGKSVKSAIAEHQTQPEIEAAQPNFYYSLAATPNDPQWTAPGMYGLPKISAPAAWDLTTGSSTVVVANIDTGMRYTHEDLAANMWTNPGEIQGNGVDDDLNGYVDDVYGYDTFSNDGDPLDEHGHGTHTGGTIGAVGNNSLGVVGVNWNVRIMAIKIYDATPTDTTSAMLINAYNYVRLMKIRGINIRVTNNSYAGCNEACGYDQATKDALDAMGNVGILNVFAAGNNAWNNDTTPAPAYPAAYTSPSVLTAASTTNADNRSSFSNWGPISVDLAAPGSSILSTTNGSNSSYGTSSGTSMAAPHVTGAAALLSGHNPSLSAASLKATLMNTVDPLTTWGATPIKTNGRLNVFNALQNQTVCSFTPSSSEVRINRKGGYLEIGVIAPNNCDFFVHSDKRWIRVQGSDSQTGTSAIRLFIDSSQVIARTGILTVAGQSVTIRQASF